MKEFPNTRKPSHWRVCGEFWNLGGQHNWEKKKKEPTDYMPTHDSQWRGSPDARIHQQQRGLNREARVACIGWGPGLNSLRTI